MASGVGWRRAGGVRGRLDSGKVHLEAKKHHRGEWEIVVLTLTQPSGNVLDLSAVPQRQLSV